MRWFNTAGPCKHELHYMSPPLDRLPRVERIIAQQGYFVIHAPRQVGKTTAMLTLAHKLTSEGQYAAVMVSAEGGSALGEDIGAVERALLQAWREDAEDQLPEELWPTAWPAAETGQAIRSALRSWSKTCPRPLALFIDEIDSLQGQSLLSVLRQLRSGYPSRPQSFPHSVALIGLRDVRDYKTASGGSDRLNTSSPFNIKVASLTMRNFNAAEVQQLYQQHTDETGQAFSPEAIARTFELTQGQPWLVNALAKEIIEVLVPDESQMVEIHHVNQAKEILIRRQDTHIDSLAARLREERVQAILAWKIHEIWSGRMMCLSRSCFE